MDTLTIVEDLACDVRVWVEELADKQGGYSDLSGYCAIASAELFKRMQAVGIDCELQLATSNLGSHVFVLWDDMIVDVTATQFREYANVAVNIVHHREVQHLWYYKSEYRFECYKELRRAQVKWGWPQEQIAFAR